MKFVQTVGMGGTLSAQSSSHINQNLLVISPVQSSTRPAVTHVSLSVIVWPQDYVQLYTQQYASQCDREPEGLRTFVCHQSKLINTSIS